MKNFLMLLVAMLFLSQASAQKPYSNNFQQEYFFGNLPNVKTEAMGRADVAIGGQVSSLFLNPAGLSGIENRELNLSTSAPYYVLKNSNFYFGGYAQRILPWLVAALSVNQMAVGETTFDVDFGNGVRYPLDKGISTNYALSVAGEVVKGLNAGLNINFYNMKFFKDIPSGKALHLDLGALYKLPLGSSGKQRLQFGGSINNFTATSISFQGQMGEEESNNFPVVARLGAAYLVETQITLPGAGEGSLELVFTTEYQNLLNSAYRTAFRLGTEAIFWKVLAVRLGFYTENADDNGFASNRDRISNFTYGFGMIIPLDDLTKDKLPFSLHLDYVSLEQPSYTYSGSRLPNMRGFAMRLVWPLEAQN